MSVVKRMPLSLPILEKIGRVTSKFKNSVEVQTKSIKSAEAHKHGVQEIFAVIDGKIKLTRFC